MAEKLKEMNKTDFDAAVCEAEGGKVNLPIAQVSEVRRLVFLELKKKYTASAILKAIEEQE